MSKETKLSKKEQEKLNVATSNRERDLKKYKDYPQHSKVPTYQYKVGDIVEYRRGSRNPAKVLEVLENGSILLVENNSNEFFKSEYCFHLEVIPQGLELKTTMSQDRDTLIQFHNGQIEGILSYYYSFGIDMTPSYQRDFVWTNKDKESLIKSIFNNIEIGKFALIELPYEDNRAAFEILDGKQRLNALIEFNEDRFSYNGVFFSQLSRRDKYHFRDYPISLGMGKDMSLAQKLNYFLKLNVGGVPQSPEHLAKVEQMLKDLKK